MHCFDNTPPPLETHRKRSKSVEVFAHSSKDYPSTHGDSHFFLKHTTRLINNDETNQQKETTPVMGGQNPHRPRLVPQELMRGDKHPLKSEEQTYDKKGAFFHSINGITDTDYIVQKRVRASKFKIPLDILLLKENVDDCPKILSPLVL